MRWPWVRRRNLDWMEEIQDELWKDIADLERRESGLRQGLEREVVIRETVQKELDETWEQVREAKRVLALNAKRQRLLALRFPDARTLESALRPHLSDLKVEAEDGVLFFYNEGAAPVTEAEYNRLAAEVQAQIVWDRT